MSSTKYYGVSELANKTTKLFRSLLEQYGLFRSDFEKLSQVQKIFFVVFLVTLSFSVIICIYMFTRRLLQNINYYYIRYM